MCMCGRKQSMYENSTRQIQKLIALVSMKFTDEIRHLGGKFVAVKPFAFFIIIVDYPKFLVTSKFKQQNHIYKTVTKSRRTNNKKANQKIHINQMEWRSRVLSKFRTFIWLSWAAARTTHFNRVLGRRLEPRRKLDDCLASVKITLIVYFLGSWLSFFSSPLRWEKNGPLIWWEAVEFLIHTGVLFGVLGEIRREN